MFVVKNVFTIWPILTGTKKCKKNEMIVKNTETNSYLLCRVIQMLKPKPHDKL